jgi:hypothetical protein
MDKPSCLATLLLWSSPGAHSSFHPAAMFMSGPVLVGLAAFGTHTAMGYALTAAVAFPALALFNLLRFPIIMMPSQVGRGSGREWVVGLSCCVLSSTAMPRLPLVQPVAASSLAATRIRPSFPTADHVAHPH